MEIAQILFRGKEKTGILNHSWLKGSLDNTDSDFPRIIFKDRFGNRIYADVDKSTIGQYIGRDDINKRNIFEGDIVEYILSGRKNKNIGYIKYYKENCSFVIIPNDIDFCYPDHDYIDDVEYMKVIGNIFDNTNLIV